MADESRSPLFPIAQIGFVLLASFVVYNFVGAAREGEMRRRCAPLCQLKPAYAGASRAAPNFELKDMSGKPVSLASFKGKTVVLNFWTKTCGPCREEMPELAELTHVLRKFDDVVVLTISTDEGPDDVRAMLKSTLREDPPFSVLFDPEAATVSGKYGTRLYPETWIIDARGVIRARFDGAREWTSASVTELVEQVRSGSYCPVEIEEGRPTGEAAKLCETVTGG